MTDTPSRIVPFATPYAPRRIWSNDYGFCVEQAAALAYLKWRGVSACVADDGALCWQMTGRCAGSRDMSRRCFYRASVGAIHWTR